MNTLTLTDADFDSNGIYIGKTDISNFDGNLKIETNYARFLDSVNVTGFIEAGDCIEAGGSIEAGSYIRVDGYIKVDGYIETGGSIESDSAKLRIFAGAGKVVEIDGKKYNKEPILKEIVDTANDINKYLMDESIPTECYQTDIDRKLEMMMKNISKLLDNV
jgi:hypothetical protein